MHKLKDGRWRVTVHRDGKTWHVGIYNTYAEARWGRIVFVQTEAWLDIREWRRFH